MPDQPPVEPAPERRAMMRDLAAWRDQWHADETACDPAFDPDDAPAEADDRFNEGAQRILQRYRDLSGCSG